MYLYAVRSQAAWRSTCVIKMFPSSASQAVYLDARYGGTYAPEITSLRLDYLHSASRTILEMDMIGPHVIISRASVLQCES